MTREEKQKAIDALKISAPIMAMTQEKFDDYIQTLNQVMDWLEQEPCTDAQERYEDLCEYFGDAKDILKSRKDFKAWLERIRWHIHKAEELYEKYEYKQEPCDVFDEYGNYKYPSDVELTEPNTATSMPCEDAISRDAVLEKAVYTETEEGWSGYTVDVDYIKSLPSVKPQEPKTGHWIEDEYEMEVRCSACGEENDECSNYCPNCGAKMVEPQESEEI